MDYSHLIQGTREFFQGHPGKSRDNGVVIVNPSLNYPEATNFVKRNHEPSCNLQFHSPVIKSNYPAQSGTHGTLSRRYPEPYSEDSGNQQQLQTSCQRNKPYATNSEVKDYTSTQSHIAYATHTHKIQYEGQKVWEQRNYSEAADIWSNTRSNHNQPISAVPFSIPRMVTPVAYQGHHQQIPVKNNERVVPVTYDLHRGYAPEVADCSSYSKNFVRPPFVQNFMPKTIYPSHRSVASRSNVNLTQFWESSRQPICGKFYSQSLHLASHSLNQADNMLGPVSCDCLFNRPCPLHRHSKQHDSPIIKRQSSEWDSRIQNKSIRNNLTRQGDEYTSSKYLDERPYRNSEMMRHHHNSSHQNQEFPTTISNNNAFALACANVEADVSSSLSTNFRPHSQTCLAELSRVKSVNNLGSESGVVSVIQRPKNHPANSFGSREATKKNEERVSVISYSRKHNLSDGNITLSNVISSTIVQGQSLPANATVSWPKEEPAIHVCESLQSSLIADSIPQLHQVSIADGYSNSRSVEKQSNRTMKPPKSKIQSIEKSINRNAPTHSFVVNSTPLKSDPIVSDEKWEEWQTSFDTEWNAFVKDLAGSGNIKRIHRVTQPIPKKIKRREQAQIKPMKGSLESKLPGITDFSSDEDIPLSLRRKTKEDSSTRHRAALRQALGFANMATIS